ncbi:MAG: DUF3597 domain-containing protein [Chthoniobacterales bacterium]
MGLLSTIFSKVLGTAAPKIIAPKAPEAGPVAVETPAASAPSAAPEAPAAPAPEPVDVDAVLSELASKNSEKLDWKKSIVDLMKLLDMDSSLSNRKELAAELGYTGDTSDSASMNIWLHKEVIKQLAKNGGKVPAELLD